MNLWKQLRGVVRLVLTVGTVLVLLATTLASTASGAPAQATPKCTARYKIAQNWPQWNRYQAMIEVTNNTGNKAAKVMVQLAPGHAHQSGWGATFQRSGNKFLASRANPNNVKPNQKMTFGYVSTGKASQRPTMVKLGGAVCALNFGGQSQGTTPAPNRPTATPTPNTPTATPASNKPCDIYKAGGTPCVAAHSTTRALYKGYKGPLYEVVKNPTSGQLAKLPAQFQGDPFDASQKKKIYPRSPGGIANSTAQDNFCRGVKCFIVRIFDQSGNRNHLERWRGTYPGGGPDWNNMSPATANAVRLNGQKVYGVHFERNQGGYRQSNTRNIPVGDQSQGIYAIFDAQHWSVPCCMGYGNAQISGKNEGPGTMEALYFGTTAQKRQRDGRFHVTPLAGKDDRIAWGFGNGPGPWLMADLEFGVFTGSNAGYNNVKSVSRDWEFVTGFLKGRSNWFEIRGANSERGAVTDYFAGKRPNRLNEPGIQELIRRGDQYTKDQLRYHPARKQGSIILGTGGDNSRYSQGSFFEGAITRGFPNKRTENLVQTNIAGAKYRKINPGMRPQTVGYDKRPIKPGEPGFIRD